MRRSAAAIAVASLFSVPFILSAEQPVPQVGTAVGFAVSRPVRELGKETPDLQNPRPAFVVRDNERLRHTVMSEGTANVDAALQSEPLAPNIPVPSLTFEGLSSADNLAAFGGEIMPPDTNGDVGPNHYVQMTNLLVRIWDKNGNPLVAPFKLSSLFAAVGGPCATADDGDPIVLYDPLADRWLLSQFCTTNNPNFHEMIAISKTGDPTGAYFVWDFVMPNAKFNDYPHFGVWPDAYYVSANQFLGDTSVGAGAFAFDRSKMLLGDPLASYIYFDIANIYPNLQGLLPTDLDGYVAPPAGTPNLFVSFLADELGDAMDGLRIFEFRPNFANPAASTFLKRPDVAVAAFDGRQPASRNNIEQPPPATSAHGLDSIADRLMNKLNYRVLAGGVQSYVLNFTVNVSGVNPTSAASYQAGVRWTELRRSGAGAITVNNQGTYAPGAGNGATGENLWMGSVAQDNQGNIALGFSQSSTTTFPSIRYAGRLVADGAGLLGQGEAVLVAGTGSQVVANGRWGDYSAMTVDPADDCTFWMTSEYRTAANNGDGFAWNTRIGRFKFASCTAAQKGTLQGTVTNCVGGTLLADARVILAEGFFRATGAAGTYSMGLPPGTYSVSVSKPGFLTTGTTVTVTNGGTTTFSVCLTPAPLVVTSPSLITADTCNVNGAIDPGEPVTLSLCLKNTGTTNTGSVTATLQASGGVTSPGAPQNYGTLVAGGAAVCRNFSFVGGGVCGGTLTARLQLQDGVTNLGTVAYNFTEGAQVLPLNENFDGVTVPNLPAGWTATNATGPAPLWVTSDTAGPDSPPNAAFVNDPTSISDKRLDTPVFAIGSASAQLSFRNIFSMEWDGVVFYDGGVLEIKIGAGSFTDILAAGGSFVSGGYNATLETGGGNPLSGRQAWSGPSGGYFTTIVNLPAAAAGQNVQFRFRMGSDNFVSAPGWEVDGITVTDHVCCGAAQSQALVVDAHAGPLPTVSNLDGVFAPGETVQVEPAWKNNGATSLSPTGTGSLFTGPVGPIYTFNDPSASYGTIVAGGTNNCVNATGNCFQMGLNNPTRPVMHWDATFLETLAPGGATKTWVLHVGSSFTDVPPSFLFYRQVEAILHNNITTGCGGALYCPNDPVTRLQMAIFIARAQARGDGAVGLFGSVGLVPYYCASGGLSLFTDVPTTDPFCRHVHYILSTGVTTGCAPGNYCPAANVTRSQMGIFIARAVVGSDAGVPLAYGPDPITGRSYSCDPTAPNVHFTDLSTADFFCRHIDYLWARDIIGGFPDGTYGPNLNVTRGQMAKFLFSGFNLSLY